METEKLVTRAVTRADLAVCARIYVETFAEPPYLEQRHSSDIARIFEQGSTLCRCAVLDGRIVAAAFCSPSEYEEETAGIREFFVLAGYRGMGVGRALFRDTEETLANSGFRWASLTCHRITKPFWEKMGFRHDSSARGWWDRLGYFFMRKPLEAASKEEGQPAKQ